MAGEPSRTPTQSTGSAGGARPRVPVLDGLRGLAILLVLLHHQTVIGQVRAGESVAACSADRIFERIVSLGWCGVDLFFVLSGFLITGILLESRRDHHYFRTFYARRTLRIFPLYYAVVFFSLVVLPWIGAHVHSEALSAKLDRFGHLEGSELWYWLYLSNFAIAFNAAFQHGILDVSWSLAIEEQFYLVWPAVVRFCSRYALTIVCVVLIAIAIVLRAWLVLTGSNPFAPYVLTPARFDALAIGALIAIAVRQPASAAAAAAAGAAAPAADPASGLAWLRPTAKWVLPSALIACAAFLVFDDAMGYDTSRWLPDGFDGRVAWMAVFGFTLLPLGFAALLVLTVTAAPHSALARFFSSALMRMFGRYSYALYLFHVPVRAVIRDLLFGPNDPLKNPRVRFPIILGSEIPAQFLFYVISTAVTLALAWLSWNLLERQFLKLNRFFRYHAA